MGEEIKNAVMAADKESPYDEKAKRLLGHKYILAYILLKTVGEFKGMNPKDVVLYIEGEPMIGEVPVEPRMTNAQKEKQGQRVVGFNSENAEINEGLVRFDIVEKEYNIPAESRIREDVSAMCNLSQGIIDDTNLKVVINMHKKGYTSEQIAEIVEKSIEKVEAIIAKKKMVLS